MRLINNLKIVLLLIIAIGALTLIYYVSYERGKRTSLNLTQSSSLTPSSSNLPATPSPTTTALEKPCEQSEDRINCFVSYLSKNPLSDDIAKSDDKLKDYFSKNLDTLTFTGISGWKFDKYSDKEIVLVSFKEGDEWAPTPVHNFIIREKEKGKWRTFYQNIGEYEKFTNDPRQLIKNEPPFFIGRYSPIVGTCVSNASGSVFYRLENNNFKPIWNIDTYSIDTGDGMEEELAVTTVIETDINFQDVDRDNNLEVIRQGNKKIWKGMCNIGSGKEKKQEIYEVYKWNTQKQTFIKINKI